MKRGETLSNGRESRNHGKSFLAMLDSRKRKIPGLWQRGSQYYAQLRVDLGDGRTAPRRIALPEATNLDEAKSELERTRTQRHDDSSWLFPSPQRGSRDVAARTLRESLLAVRKKANLPLVGFHDLRHFFASQCVMAGLDFMTIAAWLGHSDGGILVGKVYGHLADTHKKAAAWKLRFFELEEA